MAAVEVVTNVGSVTAADEDESYLYGEAKDTSVPTQSKKGDLNASAPEFVSNNNAKTKVEEEEEGDFEDSDDDDNIQVHIGEVNTAHAATNPYGTPGTWKKEGAAVQALKQQATAVLPNQKKIDVNAVGLINGQPIYEYDIDTEMDDKPWRKPGADITDYFNYGFNEDTWKLYCEKQRRMRLETNRGPYSVTAAPAVPTNAQVEIEVLPDGRTRVKAGPPPDRKVEGSIHVIGSDADARRKQKEDELLALALGSTARVINPPPAPFPPQRPMYTALPGGGLVLNPETSQAQPIQPLGVPMGAPQVFPNVVNVPDQFLHPGNMVGFPGYQQKNNNSDSDYDSEDGRRHRSSRRDASRHSSSRRHRERSDRDRGDRDRSKVRSDRDRSSHHSSRREHSSKSSSDRKKHSSRIKQEKGEDEDSDRRRRRSRDQQADNTPPPQGENVIVKQEPNAE